MYGLCDLGLGYPELGYVRLSELQSTTVHVRPCSVGIGLEQDLYFKPSHSLSVYAEAAQQHGATTHDLRLLDAAQDYRWDAGQPFIKPLGRCAEYHFRHRRAQTIDHNEFRVRANHR